MRFNYVAYNIAQGVVKGRVEARDQAEARAEVVRGGYKPLRVTPSWRLPSLEDLFPSLFGVGTGVLIRLCRQLATMLSSGGNLLRVLEMLQSENSNRVMRRVLEAIRRKVDEGGALSEALAEHPKVFSPLFVSVVEVGEYTGQLGPSLDQMATILEKEHEAKQKAMRTMMYPMAIIGLSMVTLGVLMTVALPPLLKVFDQMGTQVPLMTRIAMTLLGGVKGNFPKIFLALIILGTALWLVRRIPRMRYWLDAAQIRAPLLGSLILAGELSRFSRTMAMLLEAGVSLAAALQQGMSGCKNLVLRRAFADAEEGLMSGHGLTEALRRHPILPTIFVELVMIGEESNSLRRTMGDAADAYQKQLDQRLDSILGMLEPAATVVVAAIVAFIAFSMFLPIYSGLNAIP